MYRVKRVAIPDVAPGDQKAFLRAVAAYVAENWPGEQARRVTIDFMSGDASAVLPVTSGLRAAQVRAMVADQPAEMVDRGARDEVLDGTPDPADVVASLSIVQKAILGVLHGANRVLRTAQIAPKVGGNRRFFEAVRGLKEAGVELVELTQTGYRLTPLGEEVAELLGAGGEEGEES